MSSIENPKSKIENVFVETGPATAILPARQSNLSPITVIGTEAIRNTFDAMCITQALNSREAPGVEQLVLNPDAHCGFVIKDTDKADD